MKLHARPVAAAVAVAVAVLLLLAAPTTAQVECFVGLSNCFAENPGSEQCLARNGSPTEACCDSLDGLLVCVEAAPCDDGQELLQSILVPLQQRVDECNATPTPSPTASPTPTPVPTPSPTPTAVPVPSEVPATPSPTFPAPPSGVPPPPSGTDLPPPPTGTDFPPPPLPALPQIDETSGASPECVEAHNNCVNNGTVSGVGPLDEACEELGKPCCAALMNIKECITNAEACEDFADEVAGTIEVIDTALTTCEGDGGVGDKEPPEPFNTVVVSDTLTQMCADALNECGELRDEEAECEAFATDPSPCCDAFTFVGECMREKLDSDCSELDDVTKDFILENIDTTIDQACADVSAATPSPSPATEAPTPSPSAESRDLETDAPEGDDICFPADAEVEMADGTTKRMDALQTGDSILAAPGAYSTVYFFSHRLPASRLFKFVDLTTDDGSSLSLSPNHLLVTPQGLTAARSMRVADTLYNAKGHPVRVVSVSTSQKGGLYNPHTMMGQVVVNGICASAYTTTVPSSVAHAMLLPIRLLYRLGFVVDGMLDAGCPKLLRPLVLSS